MFISNADKQYLLDQVKALVKDMNAASTEITMLKAKVKVLEGIQKVKKEMTEAQNAKQREYMKAYKARKKAEKLAQVAA